MSSTSTNKQPLLIDRPLLEVQVLTTAAVGDRNQDTYQVQGGQSPVLLVDMDRALTDDDNSGGVIDTIELVRNHRLPDVDVSLDVSGLASQITYQTGMYVYAPSGFYETDLVLSETNKAVVDHLITSDVGAEYITFSSGELVYIPSGLPSYVTVNTTTSGTGTALNQYDYIYVATTSAITDPAALPSGVGVYQYSGSVQLSGIPAEFSYLAASGLVYLGAEPGTASSSSGYYLYTGSGFSNWSATTTYSTASGFTRFGVIAPTYIFPQTFNQYELIEITTADFIENPGQLPNGIGIYQYTRSTPLSQRPDTISFTALNGFTYLGTTKGSYSDGPGYYQYTNANSYVNYDVLTPLTADNGFIFIGDSLSVTFEEVEICFYHVRQKVNPVANDGDYKFLGTVTLSTQETRADALLSLPHISTPIPHVLGSSSVNPTTGVQTDALTIDKPGKNRGLLLQRGDALYCGLYATTGTSINYAKGITVIAQGGYY